MLTLTTLSCCLKCLWLAAGETKVRVRGCRDSKAFLLLQLLGKIVQPTPKGKETLYSCMVTETYNPSTGKRKQEDHKFKGRGFT